jgi:phage terminase large subunit
MSEISISEKYQPLFEIPEGVDTFICTGGRGSGKSWAVSLSTCGWAVNDGHRILYSRYTNVSSKDSIIPELAEKINVLGFEDAFTIKETRIESNINESKIVFKGLKTGSNNQTASLKSLKDFSCWVLEEAEELDDPDLFQKVSLSIRGNSRASGQPNIKVLILNPTTKEHWIYKEFFEDRGVEAGFNGIKDNVCYIHTSYLDCIDHIPDEMIREFEYMKVNKPAKYEHVVLGGWLNRAEGVVYNNWRFGEFDDSLPYIYGMDFGFSIDPTALVKIAIDDKRNIIYAKEELCETGLTTNDIALRLQRVAKKDLIIADSAEPRLIKEIRQRGFNIRPCVKGPDSIRAGIKKVQEYELIVEGVNLGKELNNYVWSDKKSDTPIDAYNHILDSVRYAVSYQKIKGRAPRVRVEN